MKTKENNFVGAGGRGRSPSDIYIYTYIYIYILVWTCAYPCTEHCGSDDVTTLHLCCQAAVCQRCFVMYFVLCFAFTAQVGHTDWFERPPGLGKCNCFKPDFQDFGSNFYVLGLQFGGVRALVAPLENPDLNSSFLFQAFGDLWGAKWRPTATQGDPKHAKGDQK